MIFSMMNLLGQDDDVDPPTPPITQAGGSSAEQPSKRQRLSTPNSSERTDPTVAPKPRSVPPVEQGVTENTKVLDADQGNTKQTPAFEVGGSSAAAAEVDEFGDESPYYTDWLYVLNEKRRIAKVDFAIEDRRVAMGLVSTLLTPMDAEIMQSQSSTDLRVDHFHALVAIRTLEILFILFFIRPSLYSI